MRSDEAETRPRAAPGRASAARAPEGVARVTVVVLNYCAAEDTRECIRSLLASDYPALDILLVDNGSPDGSGEEVHALFPQVRFLQTGGNFGYTGGNNRGIERALSDGCDYVLVINNDTLVEPAAVGHLLAAACENPAVGAVGPKILYASAPSIIWFGGGDLHPSRAMGYHRAEGSVDDGGEGRVETVSFLTGCCLLIPAEVLRKMGAFQEDFFIYAEDVEFSLRLSRAGYDLLYQPAARIYHKTPPLLDPPSPMGVFLGARNRKRIARRSLSPIERVRFALFFYPSRFVRMMQYLGRADLTRARALLRGLRER